MIARANIHQQKFDVNSNIRHNYFITTSSLLYNYTKVLDTALILRNKRF